jgi:hypothetical protein
MSKDSFWFKHDSNAKDDLKLLKIKKIYTHWGIGIYWEVIECLRNEPNYRYSINESDLQFLCEDLLRCKDFSKFKTWFKDCLNIIPEPLFNCDQNYFWSDSLNKRMREWEILKTNGIKGGRPKKPERKPSRKPRSKPERKPEAYPLDKIRLDLIDKKEIKEEYIDCFSEWLIYKQERKETYKSDKSILICYKHLLNLSNNNPGIAKLIIDQSMANNWAGLFEFKGQVKNDKSNIQIESKRVKLENYEFNK